MSLYVRQLQLGPASRDVLAKGHRLLRLANRQARDLQGQAFIAQGRRDEARPYIERFVREAPPARYAQDIARFKALLAQ